MKALITTILCALSLCLQAQTKIPVIKAGSKSAKIYEAGNSVSSWGIDPKTSPDIYTTNKITKRKKVTFKTDIDSITLWVKPGEQKDLIVLLNGKDSCLTRIKSPEIKNFSNLKPELHDSIPFRLNQYNTNLIAVSFNHQDSLQMNFDTGATEMSLTTDALTKKVKSNPELYSRLLDIKLGNRTYQSKVYDIQVVGHEADGLLGWDIFDGMIVELNYDKKLMAIHSRMPDNIINNPKTSSFKIKYINNKPFIEGFIFHDKQAYKNWFLFDTGYQRTAILDNDLLKTDKFPTEKMEVIKKVIMRGTQNNEIPVITAKLQKLKLGKIVLENIPAQLLGSAKPMPGINIHILGSDILKRFNTYIDLQKDVIYLMPNQLYGMNYADQNKS